MPSSPHSARRRDSTWFHGGSGYRLRDIHEALDYGVVKMNIDTDMQIIFTRVIADHASSITMVFCGWTEKSAIRRLAIRAPT